MFSFCYSLCIDYFCVFILFGFIYGRVCAVRSIITALIFVIIDEMHGYLHGFQRKRDEINCILHTIGIVPIIYYVKPLLSLEIGLLVLLILKLIYTNAIAPALDEFDVFVNDGCLLNNHINKIGLQYDMLSGMFVFIFIFTFFDCFVVKCQCHSFFF